MRPLHPSFISQPTGPRKPQRGTVDVDPRHPLARRLLQAWLLNEGAGPRVTALGTGQTQVGQLLTPTWVAPSPVLLVPRGPVLKFNGTSDYVDLGTAPACSEQTVAVWINPASTAAVQCVYGDSGSNINLLNQFLLQFNQTTAKISIAWAGQVIVVTGGISLITGAWAHVVGVRAGAPGSWQASIYVNGKPDTSATTAANPSAPQAASIGRPGAASSQFFPGQIADVRVWGRALTADEVLWLFREPYDLLRGAPVRVFSTPSQVSLSLSSTDAAGVRETEVAGATASPAPTETVNAVETESAVAAGALAAAESDAVATVEVAAPSATVVPGESGTVVGVEAVTPASNATAGETGAVLVAEALALTAALAPVEAVGETVAEVAAIAAPLAAAEPAIPLALTEAGLVAVAIAAADSGVVGIAEAPSVTQPVSAVESGAVTLAELLAVAASLAPVESGALVETDAAALVADLVAVDALSISDGEIGADTLAVAAAEALTLAGIEAGALVAAVDAVDAVGIVDLAANAMQDVGAAMPPAPAAHGGSGGGFLPAKRRPARRRRRGDAPLPAKQAAFTAWPPYFPVQTSAPMPIVLPAFDAPVHPVACVAATAGDGLGLGTVERASVTEINRAETPRPRRGPSLRPARRVPVPAAVVVEHLLRSLGDRSAVGLAEGASVEVPYDAVREAIAEDDDMILLGVL